eukprot:934140-Amorphochlora_amoeboformis.AAC.1
MLPYLVEGNPNPNPNRNPIPNPNSNPKNSPDPHPYPNPNLNNDFKPNLRDTSEEGGAGDKHHV